MPTLSIPVPNPPDILYRQANQSAEPAVADPTTDPVVGSNALGPGSATIVTNGDSGHPEEVSNLSPSPGPTESMRPTAERRYLQTDVGNADRLVDTYGADLLYCPEHLTYMVWTGQRWVPDHDSHLVEALAENTLRRMFSEAGGIDDKDIRSGFLRFVNASLSRKGICNMCYSARRKVKAKKLPQFDSKCNLLNFVNGTVDLRTGRLQRHSRADLITKMIPFAYDPRATCPYFLESLARILPDSQLREFVQTAFGCAGTGKPEKALFVFAGTPEGDNGKTTLLEIIRKTLGDHEYSGQVMVETLMMKPKEAAVGNNSNADLADLAGKRFITSSESDRRQQLNCAKVKYLTGRSQIRARYLRKPFFDFEPTHKLFLDCNYPPVMDDPNDAVWNRVKIIPFKTRLTKDQIDPGLHDKLIRELPGIAVWIVEGAKRYLSDGLPTVPMVQEATEAYRAESDALGGFFADRCHFGPAEWVGKTELWDAYCKHSRGGREILEKKDFEIRLRARGLIEAPRKHNTVRAWVGVELAEDPGDDDNNVQLNVESAARLETLAVSLDLSLPEVIDIAVLCHLNEKRVPPVGPLDLGRVPIIVHFESPSNLQKTRPSVQLSPEMAQRSRALASAQNVPLSDVMRKAVSSYLEVMVS